MLFLVLVSYVLTFLMYNIYLYFKVPDHLKNVPSVPILHILMQILKKVPYDDTYKSILQNILEKHGFARWWGVGGWGLVVQDPELVKEVYSKPNVFAKVQIESRFNLGTKVFGTSNIVSSNGEQWRRHRKVANPAFHNALPIDIFSECTLDTIQKIDEGRSGVDIGLLFQKTTLDALGKAIFNYDFQSVKGKSSALLDAYNDMIHGVMDPVYGLFPVLERVYLSKRRKAGYEAASVFQELLKNVIEGKRSNLLNEKEKRRIFYPAWL